MQFKANHVAKLIKNRRKDLNYTQQELQKNLGYKSNRSQYLSNIERGLVPFPVKYIGKLSQALKVSEEMIIELMARDYKEQLLEEVKKEF
jgi:transcriptional regulator with XRE-family HTH domain